MKRIILTLLLLISLPVTAGVTALNAEELIGVWKIYNEADTELASIDIGLAITKEGVSEFTYKTLGSESSDDEQLQGLMVNQKQVIFEALVPGQSNTYVFDIDFEAKGGPGKLLKTVYADCSIVGVDTDLVKKKYQARLASSSQLCTQKSTEESSLTNLKLVKDGTDPSTISTTASIPSEFTSDLASVSEQIESAWKIKNSSKNSQKFLIKDTSTNILGYEFIYRIINNKTKLKNLTEAGFKSSERIGLLLDEYLIVNNSFFKEKNGLSVIDLNKNRRKGKGNYILTANSDCFPSKSGASSTRVCTPNFDTSLANSISQKSSKASAQRINTKTKISF
jgi:hypothetical protein